MELHGSNGATTEPGASALVHGAGDRLRKGFTQCEEQVRRAPAKSLLLAVAAGCLLRNLPIPALVGGLARLILALLRPAVLLFASAKLLEVLQHRARKDQVEQPPFPR